MPLLDHFHPPLQTVRHWHSFHHAWACNIAFELNRLLPEGYVAEPNVQYGIENDVAAFEREGAAVAVGGWPAPAPLQTIPMPVLTDVVEVRILAPTARMILAAAIELVSPSNKSQPSSRDAFVSKCLGYLKETVGLAIVDIVTQDHADLHAELMEQLGAPGKSDPTDLYAASYRPVEVDNAPSLEIWHETLSLGKPLPTLPLWLRGSICLPLDLDATYTRTCAN